MAKSGGRKRRPQGCSLRSHRLRRLKPLTPTLSPATHSAMPSMLPCCTSDLKRRAQMAATPAASVSGPRPRRRLSLPALHPAGRVLAHPGARPAGDGAHLLRGGDPREPRYRPPQPSKLGVRPQGEPPHTGAIPHPRHHRRRSAFAARRLQEDPHQAIPQGGTGASNRNDDQRHPRLRHRPTHRKSRATAQDRLCSQPTSA